VKPAARLSRPRSVPERNRCRAPCPIHSIPMMGRREYPLTAAPSPIPTPRCPYRLRAPSLRSTAQPCYARLTQNLAQSVFCDLERSETGSELAVSGPSNHPVDPLLHEAIRRPPTSIAAFRNPPLLLFRVIAPVTRSRAATAPSRVAGRATATTSRTPCTTSPATSASGLTDPRRPTGLPANPAAIPRTTRAVPAPNRPIRPPNLHHRGRFREPTRPTLNHHRRPAAKASHRRQVLLDLGHRRRTLDREHYPAWTRQRKAPRGKPVQWRNGPGGDHVRRRQHVDALLGPRPHHVHRREAQRLDDLAQKGGPTRQRLHEGDPEVRAGHC
jgi:hypothetical protein